MRINKDAWELLRETADGSVDLVLTDPPYGLENPSNIDRSQMGKTDLITNFEWDEAIPIRELIHEIGRVLKRGAHAIVFFNHRNYSHILDYGEEVGLVPRDPIVFRKTNPSPRLRKVGMSASMEFAAWMTKAPVSQDRYNWQLSQQITNCFSLAIPKAEGASTRHPTQKPLTMGIWLVALFTKPHQVVMDPFAGSGTFPVAARLLDREIAMAESDDMWREVAEDRILKAKSDPDALRVLERVKKEIFAKDKFTSEKNFILNIDQTTLEDWI